MPSLYENLTRYEVWLKEGHKALANGKPAAALQHYEKAASLRPGANQSFAAGVALEAMSQAERAVVAYREAILYKPDHIESRVNLGALLRKQGRHEEALHHHMVAYGLAPDLAVVAYNFGVDLLRLELVDAGRFVLDRALKLDPSFRLAQAALKSAPVGTMPDGTASFDGVGVDASAGSVPISHEAAAAAFESGLRERPSSVPGWTDYGSCLLHLGRIPQAEDAELRALALAPHFAPAWHNLGVVRRASGSPGAGDAFRQAIACRPDLTQSWIDLSRIYKEAGDAHGRFDALFVASRSDDAREDLLAELVDTSAAVGRFDIGGTALNAMVRSWPNHLSTHVASGLFFSAQGDHLRSLKAFEAALNIDPGAPLALANRGAALHLLGRLEDAYEAYLAALMRFSDSADLLTRCIHIGQYIWRWDAFPSLLAWLPAAAASGALTQAQPFSLLAVPGVDAGVQLDVNRAFVQRTYGHIQALPGLVRSERHDSRIRVGYASSDYYSHATACLISDLIEIHDRSRFEIFGYSYGTHGEDAATHRLRQAFDNMIDIGQLSDREAARRIQHDDVDVLIDLKGHTEGCRMGIFAHRPARIQINYLGFPGTSGASFFDYIIADEVIIPVGAERYFSETVLRLPRCYQPNDRERPLPPRPSRADLGLPEAGTILCSFNNAYKLTPAMADVWAQILEAAPQAVLWQLSAGAIPDGRLRREFEARGIAGERVVFAPKMDHASHLARLQCADLFLDTFPYGAHTTASDALWCSVPVVTMAGTTFPSRVAASILTTAGLPALIGRDAKDYARIALDLIGNAGRLRTLKAGLTEARERSPLFDTPGFARDLEELLAAVVAGGRSRRPVDAAI